MYGEDPGEVPAGVGPEPVLEELRLLVVPPALFRLAPGVREGAPPCPGSEIRSEDAKPGVIPACEATE